MLKRFALSILAAMLLVMFAATAFAENAKPAAITVVQAQDALRSVLPDVRVLSVEPSILPGLWEVAFTSRGDKGIVYIDATKEFIVVGSVIGLTTGVNYTKKKFESINKVDFASIPLENSVILGDPKAKYKVVVFDDPD